MGKQRVHASLRPRRIKNELRLSILLQHGIVMIHGHRSVRVPVGRRPHPQSGIVQTIRQSCGRNHTKNCDHE